MSGTDSSRETPLAGPAVILVDPQLGQNIGMVARAMLNCGLEDLRLVRPRDGWPNPAAVAAAAGAGWLLERARLYETTAEAVADLHRLYATTARPRGMVKPVLTPQAGTRAVTRVMIESADNAGRRWTTVGVSPNIIDASFNALHDGITWKLMQEGAEVPGPAS